MKSLTTIIASKTFAADTMMLNDKEESIDANPRMKDVIAQLKKRAQVSTHPDTDADSAPCCMLATRGAAVS